MKAVVFSLGCKVNECESNSLITGLIERGYQVEDKLVKADLYVINTCAVTSEAEKKSRQMSARISKLNPNAKVIWTGCAVQNNPEIFLQKWENSLVTGVFEKNKILQLLDSTGMCVAKPNECFEELPISTSLKTRSFIKVQDGCNNFCSYCIIPYLRGRNRAREPKKVVDEITSINPAEAVITGINLSAYNYNGINLTGLIQALSSVNCRIRLGSLEVNVIDEQFLLALKNLKNFAPHFHLSLQSGSNSVLKSMNRHYTREEFIKKVQLIREFFPQAGITTDVIVGFPTETEEDFLQTVDLVNKVEFSDIHPFIYSARQGTASYKLKDLNHQIKKSRLDRLLEVKEQLKSKFIRRFIGKTLSFIAEDKEDGYTTGYSENYIRVYVKGDIASKKIVDVKALKAFKDGVLAQEI